jgi:predicted  nucleic acid-binding Zn-ribbon protein
MESTTSTESEDITKSDKYRNVLNINQTIKIVDKIIAMRPKLKKDRKDILDNILGRYEKKVNDYDDVLEKITIKDKVYYKDNLGLLFDADVSIVGCYYKDGTYILESERHKEKVIFE